MERDFTERISTSITKLNLIRKISASLDKLLRRCFSTNRRQDAALGYLMLRATVGTNICIHGVTRLLAGPSHFADKLVPAFQDTLLPARLVRLFALALPWTESIIGLLVLVGLGTRLALAAGSLLILTLTFGATLNQDWENAGLALIYAAVYASLLTFRYHNTFSADGLLRKNPSRVEQLPFPCE